MEIDINIYIYTDLGALSEEKILEKADKHNECCFQLNNLVHAIWLY